MVNKIIDNLVTICVITYNSEKTILDTLNSIYNQSYRNIELIISDDCSADNTILIASKWLDENKERFFNTKIITTQKNTGVTANCNRAYYEANGDFIKDIGADDILLNDYVKEVIDFFSKNPDCDVLFTSMYSFYSNDTISDYNICKDFFELNSSEQFISFIKRDNHIPTPSVIYRKDCIREIGFFDNRYPMWEDGPAYFKLLKRGKRFYLLDKPLVKYRVREDSISNGIPVRHKISMGKFYYKELKFYDFKYNKKLFLIHLIKNFFFKYSNIYFFDKLSNIMVKKR